MLLPYFWLSLAIVWLWLPPQASAQSQLSRFGVSAAWLVVAVVHAFAVGIVSSLGIAAIAAFGLICFGYSRKTSNPVSVVLLAATILFSLALMAHIVPGFFNTLIVRDAVLSQGSVPYTLFMNFDKGQIGLFLLAFGPPLIARRADWVTMLKIASPAALALIVGLIIFALLIGQIRFEPKVPEFLPIWLWSNLLFTATAEEALFRGVIQRRLQGPPSGSSSRARVGLIAAAVIFGAAHYAGGVWSVILATIAGVGYGWVFWRTNRIEASILTHFLVNTAHIVGFTYPALG